ncbi:MAG TPA: glutamate synthase-related protein, partial [Thermoanaerobaculia bacterium]|nr:glutamate synthase-related protein [Thermoanaerobaculia bacterium]
MCGVGFIADLQGRSRRVLPLALQALSRLSHRGAVDADGVTGDGAGVMIEIPRDLLAVRDEAVGMIFGRRDAFAAALLRHGLHVARWRSVPTVVGALGPTARQSRPLISQAVITRPYGISDEELERRLDGARKERGDGDFYVVSLSDRTIVYKALVGAAGLAAFYPDLRHPQRATSFALFHQRFSTNTLPSWPMTQPFRLLAHNGEINTIAGNRNWMRARGFALTAGTSDSASLDEALAISSHETAVDAAMAELLQWWEGPAMVAFADGRQAGAAVDRNGLRPARYSITGDGLVVVASETGVVELDDVVEKGRIGPGGMLVVNLEKGTIERTSQQDRWSLDVGRWPSHPATTHDQPPTTNVLRAFGYTQDEIDLVLRPMFEKGIEPIGSMGDDTPLAVLSSRPQLLYSFFKQRFAQVTNPAIDPLREAIVMDIGEPLVEEPRGHVLSLLFESNLEAALERVLEAASAAGAETIILSDRGVDAAHAAIPSLLAVSAVHQRLVEKGIRCERTIIADAGDARDDHHIAALIGFGADAVCPWLALQIAGEGHQQYRAAIRKGLLKILSKMGVSTIRSYRGAQLFEAVGIGKDVIDRYFSGTLSSIGGIALDSIERSVMARHRAAFVTAPPAQLEDAGLFRYRRRGELHAYNPGVVKALHTAARSGRPLDYRAYAEIVHQREPVNLRDLWEFRGLGARGSGLRAEPASAIVRRFMTSAMSLGALSPEAQRVIAEGMNRIGARSNSGEGGEPPEIYGTAASNRIKQVASGRFGVTAEYLVHAGELQIKIAQGSKPGEGGQLPGHKVTPFIARIRNAAPGTTLISPPPHHDIYSIEDLAQLIYDLKQVNPDATVSVKLVSSAGIGTIAVGVAKAYADAIEISGHDGGTGASPLGSIRNAGTPWEIGLAEVQQALMQAGLRDRVRLQVNGGIKTGRDVVMAALLGAEEFGFGTAALVATGCVMARQCHLNTCPVGIATQREDLRARFKATPDDVGRFFLAVAEEVREIMSLLGFETLDEIVGRTDLLFVAKESPLSFERILAPPQPGPRRAMQRRNDPP